MPGGHVGYQGSDLSRNPKFLMKRCGEVKTSHSSSDVRLFVKGIFTGYQRAKRTQNQNTCLIRLQDVNQKDDTGFYLGKKIVYIYKVKKADKEGRKYRTIWGKVTRPHGNNGMVRAQFRNNLPPKAIGKKVRVMLYPSRV